MEKTHGRLCLIRQADPKIKIKTKFEKERAKSAFFSLFLDNHLNMKKLLVICCLIGAVVVGALCLPKKEVKCDYLRLHIRANSNSETDQNIKYEIKDEVMKLLTPYLCNIESKKKAIEIVNRYLNNIINSCLNLLQQKGFNYSITIKIANEFFPTRTYSNTTLESGYYDAVIVELGEANGDNWWCVMYPPLCFVNKNENINQIKYKSIVYEWFKKLFK